MSKRQKVTKGMVPENFTLSLALVDAIPVLFFGLNALLIGMVFSSSLFMLGAILCLLGGAGKVIWKIIVVLKKKNIYFLFVQMRFFMPLGFLLIIISVIVNHSRIHGQAILGAVCGFPSVLFFLAGILGMVLMSIFAVKLDNADVKSNWIEQLTNGISQVCFFIGLLFLL